MKADDNKVFSVVDKDDLFNDTENSFWKTQKLFYHIILS